ncbi:uncharacterized protein LOC106080956 [Stomoxys calcitrans]|uniref:uncharacterized protein LOC106080956 n=1 Tax=Stomoxys calcitrans TaxID=35570 RepID=UPI0027E2E986|nr:uncharacterized protein LOC106080956 [Stomoxys calcitrans]
MVVGRTMPQAIRNYLIFTVAVSGICRCQAFLLTRTNLECFDDYREKQNANTLLYMDSHLACESVVRKRSKLKVQHSKQDIDVELEKWLLAKATEEMCSNMKACSTIEDHGPFFRCYSTTAMQGAHTSLGMHFNASAVAIELNDDFGEDQKDVMRCTLQARQKFTDDWIDIYRQLLRCLDSI